VAGVACSWAWSTTATQALQYVWRGRWNE
jgi:hypothetical protein